MQRFEQVERSGAQDHINTHEDSGVPFSWAFEPESFFIRGVWGPQNKVSDESQIISMNRREFDFGA